MAKRKKECFFVTPIGSSDSPQRKRADRVLEYVLLPAIGREYNVVRADEIENPGSITEDIMVRLVKSDLIVADLTDQNANVMYEIGIRHAFNLPIVQLAQDGQQLAFDIKDERTIFFYIGDLKSATEAKKKIATSARHAVQAKPFKSPVYRAIQTTSLFAEASTSEIPSSLIEKFENLDSKIDDLSSDISMLDFSVSSGMDVTVDNIDSTTVERVEEISRLFDQVGPSDIAKLVDAIRRLK